MSQRFAHKGQTANNVVDLISRNEVTHPINTESHDSPIIRAEAELVLSGSRESSLDRPHFGDLWGDLEAVVGGCWRPYSSSRISSAIVFFLAASTAAASAMALAFGLSATAATSSYMTLVEASHSLFLSFSLGVILI